MKYIRVTIISAFFLGLGTATFAFDARSSSDRVQINSDQSAGVVSIVIDGRSVMVVDGKGLHVTGDVDYTGAISDRGDPAPASQKGVRP